MKTQTLVVGGKTTMAVEGARALRREADQRGHRAPILVVPNRTDTGEDDWQPSLRSFAQRTKGFELVDLKTVYGLDNLYFFSLEFDRLIRTDLVPDAQLFNIHFSLLPAYKGIATSVWPLVEGREESGVTLHRIAKGIDTGPIIDQRAFAIDVDDTSRDLYLKYIHHGTALFVSRVGDLLETRFTEAPQAAAGSSYFSREEADYQHPIPTFAKTAFELRNRIRAFTFPEYQQVEIDGLQVHRARITSMLSSSPAGSIVSRRPGFRRLATIDYELELDGEEVP